MFRIRRATSADLAEVLPRTCALNAHEGIVVAPEALERALAKLLADPALGGVWLVERGSSVIGYAIVTFGYDLEFAGRDAWLTEIWIDEAAREQGAGSEALRLLDAELRTLDIHALHLQVREENPALHLYERAGFTRVPRLVLSRRM